MRAPDSTDPASDPLPEGIRDPLAAPAKVLAARRRPMSERLELALSWNAMAAELRAGLAQRTNPAPVTAPFDAGELYRALARHDVAYATISGIAIQAHGGQRLTQDLDVAIDATTANLTQLAAALLELDARTLGPDGRRSRSVPTAPLLGSSDRWHLVTIHGPLDIITLPAHLGPFAELRARAHEVPLGDLTIPIAHRDDLLRMKRAAGRPQDLADIRLLESLDAEP